MITHRGIPIPSAFSRLLRENVVFLLLAMLVVIPLLGPFTHGSDGRSLRAILLQSTGVLLLLVLLGRAELWGGRKSVPCAHPGRGPTDRLRCQWTRVRGLLQSGVTAPLVAFLLWAVAGALRAPDHGFAIAELLRLGTGALVYFTVALHLENRSQLRLLLDGLLGIAVFVLGYGLITQGSEAGRGAFSSVFTNRLQLGAVLAVLLPLFTTLALSGEEPRRRMAAIAAAILSAAGLLVTMERGPWCAAAVGLVVWDACCVLRATCRAKDRNAARRTPRAGWPPSPASAC